MTPRPRSPKAALAATTALALLLAAGCTSSHGSGGTPSTSPAIPPASSTTGSPTASTSNSDTPAPGSPTSAQLKSALISASDITFAALALTSTSPLSQSGAVGISAVYNNTGHDSYLSVIVIHYPTTVKAQQGVTGIQALAATQVTVHATNTKVTVGQSGRLYQGSNGSGPLTILVFEEGEYNVTMEFVSTKATASVPAAIFTGLGTKQDAKVKALG